MKATEEVIADLLAIGWAVSFEAVSNRDLPGRVWCRLHRVAAVGQGRDWEAGCHGETAREALQRALDELMRYMTDEAALAQQRADAAEKRRRVLIEQRDRIRSGEAPPKEPL